MEIFKGIEWLQAGSLCMMIPLFAIMGTFAMWLTVTGIQMLFDWYDDVLSNKEN